MNILDIIKTYKFWVNCFSTICSSFSDELKRKIRSFNDDLRLNFKHWNDPNIVDIFISCLFLSDGNNTTRSTTVREMFSRFKNENARAVFGEVSDAFKDLGKFPISDIVTLCGGESGNEIGVPVETIETLASSDSLNETTDAIVNSDGLEEEAVNVLNPTLIFKQEVEELLILMVKNIGSVIDQDAYEQIFSELIAWEMDYKKKQKHLDAINDVNEAVKNEADSSVGGNTRIVNPDDIEEVLPTYLIIDDYSELNDSPKPEQGQNEDLSTYYARWFDLQKA